MSNQTKHCILPITHEAYSMNGASFKTYSDLYGMAGEFYKQFKVYGQKQDPLGNKVERITTKDKRSSFFVPSLQQLQ